MKSLGGDLQINQMFTKWKTIGFFFVSFGISLMYFGWKTLYPVFTMSGEDINVFEAAVFTEKSKTIQIIWPSFIMIAGLFAYATWVGRTLFLQS